MAASFVKFEAPKDVVNKVLEAVTIAKTTGKIRKGVNETTKAIERGIAKLVVMHIPVLCEEKQVPYAYVSQKIELGKASGIDVPTSSIAVVEEGDSKKLIAEISEKIKTLKK